jgi:hypothetical protein
MNEVQRSMRNSICQLEEAMLQAPQVEIKTTHYFAEGLYAREIFIPKGTLLTGKIHKTEHLNIISKGKISVSTEDGNKIIEAPCTIISRPGTKRAGYALEDTVWTTIHATKETDLVRLEQELIAESHEQFALQQTQKLEGC